MKIPASLKAVKPYILRAREFDRDKSKVANVIVAYYCRLYAVELAVKSGKTSGAEESQFLLEVMAQLEEDKKGPAGELSEADSQTLITRAAFGLFKKADDEYMEGLATKSTAITFNKAVRLFTVLKLFGPMDPKIKEALKYAGVKAMEITKDIKAGRQPGPPEGEEKKEATPLDDWGLPEVPSEKKEAAPLDDFGLPEVPSSPLPVAPATFFAPSAAPVAPSFDYEAEARRLAATLPPADPAEAVSSYEEEARKLAASLADADDAGGMMSSYEEEARKLAASLPPAEGKDEGASLFAPGAPPPYVPPTFATEEEKKVDAETKAAEDADALAAKFLSLEFDSPGAPAPAAKAVPVIVPAVAEEKKAEEKKKKNVRFVPREMLADAAEFTRFAMRALDDDRPDLELAIVRIQKALHCIK